MDTEEGEFVISGHACSAEDAAFDQVVGVIEDFMIDFDMDAALQTLPSFSSMQDDHAKHSVYKEFVAKVEAELDSYVSGHSPHPLAEVAQLLQARQDEVTPELWEFVSEGCFDYVSFADLWAQARP